MSGSIEIYRKLILLLMHSKKHMSLIVEKMGLTPVQGMLLIHFEENIGKSMNELSVQMGCDASNTTGLVDRLDSQNLIERTVDPEDRRVKLIKLSAKGCKCRRDILEELQKVQAADLEKLTSEEKATLVKIADKLVPSNN